MVYDMESETLTDSEGNQKTYYPIYVYGAIDSTDYDEVGFDISSAQGEYTETISEKTAEVYKSMTVADPDGGESTYTAENLGGRYMFGSKLLFNAESWSSRLAEISIVPFARRGTDKLSDGKTVISDAVIKEKDATANLFREEKSFEAVFKNTDKYLYRVGNSNRIALGSLFKAVNGKNIDSSAVTLSVTVLAGNVGYTYTPDLTDWTKSQLKLSGGGAVKLKACGGQLETELYLEVVDGFNVTEYSELKASGNNILLCDIQMPEGGKYSLSNGTLFGNGFTFDISRGTRASAVQGVVVLNGATLDNALIEGAVYTEYASSSSDEYYPSAVQTFGASKITNSFLSNCRAALRMQSGSLTVENTVLFGGRYANLDIWGGDVTLRDVVTVNMPYGDGTTGGTEVLGLGILFDSSAATLNISGGLTQYNWIKQADKTALPNDQTVKSTFNELFTSSAYSPLRYTYNGTDYVNTGILSLSSGNSVNGMPSDYTKITVSNSYFVCSVEGSKADGYFAGGAPAYDKSLRSVRQGAYLPTVTRSYPEGVYNSALGKLLVTFEEGETYTPDPNFITASKFGSTLPVSVTMDGVDYTDKKITLTESGTHTIKYRWSDPYNFAADASRLEAIAYSEELVLDVTATAPEASHAEFTYSASNATRTSVIGGKTYIMPSVSEASSTVASVTVDGETVYMPIVEVQYEDNWLANHFYGYAPIFTAISITDYSEGGTGSAVIYNTDTEELPSRLAVASGSQYINGAASTEKDPQKYSVTTGVFSNKKTINYGLCWKSKKGSAISESSQNVCYSYTDNAGATYYYYIQYHFAAHELPR